MWIWLNQSLPRKSKARTLFKIFFKIQGFLFVFENTKPDQFKRGSAFAVFGKMPIMFFDSSFQVFGCASIVAFIPLALENIDIKHTSKLTKALLRVKLRRTLLRENKKLPKGNFLSRHSLCNHDVLALRSLGEVVDPAVIETASRQCECRILPLYDGPKIQVVRLPGFEPGVSPTRTVRVTVTLQPEV